MEAGTPTRPDQGEGRRQLAPALAFGALITAAAATLFVLAFSIPIRAADQVLGPRLFPLVITAALVVLGLIYIALELWARRPAPAGAENGVRWRPVALIMTGVLLFAALVQTAGFIIAETVLFVLVARAFRSYGLVKDAVIGFVLALAIFILFTQGLGLRLPAGPFAYLARLWS